MSPLTGELWPAHPKPLPDELLSSWLIRIARAHGLKLQTFCDRVFGNERQLWNRDIDRLGPEWLLSSLVRHTGTSIETVRQTTLDIYRGRLFHRHPSAGVLRWILPVGMYHRKRRNFGLQFCPQCLAEDQEPYFRTQWRLAILTWCPLHRLFLHDRCPGCNAPVAFHRRELGHPAITDAGPLSLCHACGFDLRFASRQAFTTYESSICTMQEQIASYVEGRPSCLDISRMDVMHQLCKIMVSPRKSAKLALYVVGTIDAPRRHVLLGRQALELRPNADRHHVIQLAAWLLADEGARLNDAWKAKAMRFSDLLRDFKDAPCWFLTATDAMNRRRKHALVRPS